MANFLLYASVYLFLPFLPELMHVRLGEPWEMATYLCLLFVAGQFVMGPLYAHLVDAYKRKSVLLYASLGVMMCMVGYVMAADFWQWLVLALVQGACFGVATAAGITLAIDVTHSSRRSDGNAVYAWMGRAGLLAGALVALLTHSVLDVRTLVYGTVACSVLSLLFVLRVHVMFRAPIGLPLFSLDRFLLPRAWLPALNVALIAFVPGMLMPLLPRGQYGALLGLAVLLFLILSFTKMFVRLSDHCQRSTANTTCQLAVETGLVAGMALACRYLGELSVPALVAHLLPWVGGVSLAAFVLLTPTYLYYKKKRVR